MSRLAVTSTATKSCSSRAASDATRSAARGFQAHGVPFSTLTVVNRKTAQHPLDVYRFLRDDLGTPYIQLIPCVEPRHFETLAPGHLPPAQYSCGHYAYPEYEIGRIGERPLSDAEVFHKLIYRATKGGTAYEWRPRAKGPLHRMMP
jgi:sulfatase maturation enzyme AslB (radical SAM superfamily)